MEAGPFAVGEVQASVLKEAPIGVFLLTASGPVLVAGRGNRSAPPHFSSFLLGLSGEHGFCYPGPPLPYNGFQISGRLMEVTLGSAIANSDPERGDLGVGVDGELVVAVWLNTVAGLEDMLVSLISGKEVTDMTSSNFVWVRQWRLELVSPDRSRRFTLIDRF